MSNNLTLEIKNSIANINFDLSGEKVNKLSASVMSELESMLDNLKNNKDVKLLYFTSSKKNIFIAGADINEIKDLVTEQSALTKVRQGQLILDKIAKLPFPTLAVINGACLGGGLELSLACTYRIASDDSKTSLGLPEVQLGIIPGFGGTQRLPKLIGITEAIKMITSGQPVDYKKAYKIGLIDDYYPVQNEKQKIDYFINLVLNGPKQIIKRRKKVCRLKNIITVPIIIKMARKSILEKSKGFYPAPIEALEVIAKTYNKNIDDGLIIEAEHFSKLAVGKISKNLISLFFANDEIKKQGKDSKNADKKNEGISSAMVIGSGIMGGGISWLFSKAGKNVRMKDMNLDAIAKGYQQIYKIYDELKKKRKYDAREVSLKIHHVTSTTDFSGIEKCDIIIEAIVEDLEIKKSLLKEIESKVSENTLIVSNSSSLSMTEMAKALKHPERFAGFHFFNPVNRMPLVEIIAGEETSEETINRLVNLCHELGKSPVIVGDCAGFLVNRILLPYLNEAAKILEENNLTIETLDKIMTDFGMPMGPFTLADTVGIDVGYKVAKILEDSYGGRMKVSPLLADIYSNKDCLGKKTGKGFYVYSGNDIKINKEISVIIAKNSKNSEVAKRKVKSDEKQAIDRMLFIMINEATMCLEEKIIKNPRYLDFAMIMGTGFPAFRGGLLRYADEIGISEIVAKMENLSEFYGDRFKPTKLLVDMAKNGKNFY